MAQLSEQMGIGLGGEEVIGVQGCQVLVLVLLWPHALSPVRAEMGMKAGFSWQSKSSKGSAS